MAAGLRRRVALLIAPELATEIAEERAVAVIWHDLYEKAVNRPYMKGRVVDGRWRPVIDQPWVQDCPPNGTWGPS